jgi:hypothetical protein
VTLARGKAHANPSKAFFVRMLTRDISLEDCILDLVDNSIDGAWNEAGVEPTTMTVDSALADFRIDIEFDDQNFSIVDNCGGITLNQAADYAFTFGRREDQLGDDYSVGVYGIGMKRAVFKVGETIAIRSTYAGDEGLESFRVPIDVPRWLMVSDDAEPNNWDFDIEEDEPLGHPGVAIEISSLLPEAETRLGDATYQRTLRRTLARDYMVPLMRGLTIAVNGVKVEGNSFALRENEEFAPMRERYDDGAVSVEIFAGMASLPPDSVEPGEDTKLPGEPSGWYILCNGRVVLAGDTSSLTGWGVDVPKWHLQYSGFAGAVLFTSANPSLLPMTTTKRSIDTSSAVYLRARAKMYEPARAWIDYTNARKADLDSAKAREQVATVVKLADVTERASVQLPALPTRTRAQVGNVHYQMPVKRLKALAKGFGDDSLGYREVGIRSFEYAYEDFAEEDS